MEGRFYPSTREKIFRQIREIERAGRYPPVELSPARIFGAVIPHAGHVYSGYQTIPFFQLLKRHSLFPETFIILHPNHTGLGKSLAVDGSEVWKNSAGEVPVDREMATALDLPFDNLAHSREHSAEVIVPFLQYYFEDHPMRILPVCMMDQSHRNALLLADRIGDAIRRTGRRTMVLASSDFSHFLSPEEGRAKDQLVLERVLARDPAGVERVVRKEGISVCGYGPIMALMEYAGSIDAQYSLSVLARGHSGEVFPSREVVDYLSIMVYN